MYSSQAVYQSNVILEFDQNAKVTNDSKGKKKQPDYNIINVNVDR